MQCCSYQGCHCMWEAGIAVTLTDTSALFLVIAIDWKDGKKHKYGRPPESPSQYQGKSSHPFLSLPFIP